MSEVQAFLLLQRLQLTASRVSFAACSRPSSSPTLKQSTATPFQQSAVLRQQPVFATITAEHAVAPGPTFHHATTFSFDDGDQFVPFEAATEEPDRVKPEAAVEFAAVETGEAQLLWTRAVQ